MTTMHGITHPPCLGDPWGVSHFFKKLPHNMGHHFGNSPKVGGGKV